MMLVDRRGILSGAGAASLSAALPRCVHAAPTAAVDAVGTSLAPWRPGCLDIHHISTGRGDASIILAPDGTSVMVDAGAMYDKPRFNLELTPNGTRRPGEWLARYAERRLRDTGFTTLDFLVVTHIHPDHLGDMDESLPSAPGGGYVLTGVSDVESQIDIGTILDRGFPDYANVEIRNEPFARNYRSFIAVRAAKGGRTERLRAGSASQIRLLHRPSDAVFEFRNLAVNGNVWTGCGDEVASQMPQSLPEADQPDENFYSAAFRMRYGNFTYFAAGDLTSTTLDGDLPWRDVETSAARAAGRVDVAVAAHHGLQDATGADVVRALRPRIWLIPVWHVSQPSLPTLERLFSKRLYDGPRDVFSTRLSEASALVTERLSKLFTSSSGNIVVRVEPGGAQYRIVVTDNSDENDRVIGLFGPYNAG